MLNKLNSDILYNITGYLSDIDITNLKLTCKHANYNTNCIDDYILTRNLKSVKKTKCEMYKLLNKFLKNVYNKYLDRLGDFFELNSDEERYKYVLYYLPNLNLYEDDILNTIYKKLLYHYLIYGTLTNYTNKIELFTYYNLIRYCVFSNLSGIENFVYYLDKLNSWFKYKPSPYYKLTVRYFYFLLSEYNILYLDTLNIISKYVITTSSLRRLMQLKPLDFKKTTIYKDLDYDDEFVNNLYYICILKFYCNKNETVSYNYTQFKKLCYKKCKWYFLILEKNEKSIVDRIIRITDPFSNRKMRLGSTSYKNLIKYLKQENMYNVLHKIDSYIKSKRKNLIKFHFS